MEKVYRDPVLRKSSGYTSVQQGWLRPWLHLTLLKQVVQTSQGFTDSLKASVTHTHNENIVPDRVLKHLKRQV